MARLNKSFMSYLINGSTLVEVVVAMVLISLSLGLGFMIYINLLDSYQVRLQQKARLILEKVAEEMKVENRFETTEVLYDEFSIKKQIEYPNADDKSIILSLSAVDLKNKKLAERKEFIRNTP